MNRESAAYAEGVNQPVGEKRKALKYIFTFTSAHRGLERNLSRSAFFMSFSLIACLHKIWWKRAGARPPMRRAQTSRGAEASGVEWRESAKPALRGKSMCCSTWELLTFYSLYLLGAGEGNTKRRAKVQIKCKTQIQKVESHCRHPHPRTNSWPSILAWVDKGEDKYEYKLDIRPKYVHCLCACDFLRSFTTKNVQIKSTFTWDCNATVFL